MKYRPLGLDVLVKRSKEVVKQGALYIPGKEKSKEATVVALGPEWDKYQQDLPCGGCLEVGDIVLLRDRCGLEIEVTEDVEYLLVCKSDILCARNE